MTNERAMPGATTSAIWINGEIKPNGSREPEVRLPRVTNLLS